MSKSPYVDPHKSGHEIWEEFSMSFTPAVKEVVEFAKRIPGFRDLSQHDQVNLLKAGTFEVGFVYSERECRACSILFSCTISFFSTQIFIVQRLKLPTKG